MKKFIFRKTCVPIPTLNYDVYVIVTNDFFKASRKLNHEEHDESWYGSTGAVALHTIDKGESFILLKPNASVDHVVHEAWHVIRRMFEWISAELENEMVAYHLGYLVQHTYNILKHKKSL